MRSTNRLLALSSAMLWLCPAVAFAQGQEKQRPPNEPEVILKDSQKQDPVTAKEIAECEKQWSSSSQMTKQEWSASCRSTLRYFPEKP